MDNFGEEEKGKNTVRTKAQLNYYVLPKGFTRSFHYVNFYLCTLSKEQRHGR